MRPNIGIIALDDITWTPLKAVEDCDSIEFINVLGVNLLFRTLDTDVNSEVTISPLQSKKYVVPKNSTIHKSDIIGYGKLSSGTGNIKVECVSS